MSPSGVTFNHRQVLPGAWQEVKGEAMAVNEADYNSKDCGARDEGVECGCEEVVLIVPKVPLILCKDHVITVAQIL